MALTSPTWSLQPLPVGTGLSPRSSVTVWAKLLGVPVSSSCTAMPVPDHEPCWSWPVDWFPSLTSDLPHHCGPVRWPLGCVWPWLALLDLILTCGLTSWLEVRPASSPQNCLMIWTLSWSWLPLPDLLCLPHLRAVGQGPWLVRTLTWQPHYLLWFPISLGAAGACFTLTLS